MKNPRDIIVAPVVSEKSYDLVEKNNTYTFEVDRRSNKSEIKDAIEEIFSVQVLSVNTQNRKGKVKRTGAVLGRRNHVKRALVTLAQGDNIDLFGI
ncbi:MAG: 50S ribosomal protein L23 [Acidimicrobiia bacterium]|nr:50S ribosomal protein L23 [Acidimicrobiia bacterium]